MCLRFVAGHPHIYTHRGGPMFEAYARWNRLWLLRWLYRGHRVYLHGGQAEESFRIRPCELLMWPMPANAEIADLMERHPFAALVVDYHADVLGILDADDVSPAAKQAARSVPDDAWRWWNEPERRRSLTRGLMAADVITTPWGEWVGPLARTFGKPVVLLPDSQPDDYWAFMRTWRHKIHPLCKELSRRRHHG